MGMRKSLAPRLIVGGALLIVASAAVAIILPSLLYPKTDLWLGDGIFRVNIAMTENERSQGWGVQKPATNQAWVMAFPNEDVWAVETGDTEVSVDIVWLNQDKKVVHIVKNAPSEKDEFKPATKSKYAIKLRAGTVDSKAITLNRTAIFDINTEDIK